MSETTMFIWEIEFFSFNRFKYYVMSICAICLDPLNKETQYLFCDHGYHDMCLIDYILFKLNSPPFIRIQYISIPCPLCRNNIDNLFMYDLLKKKYNMTRKCVKELRNAIYMHRLKITLLTLKNALFLPTNQDKHILNQQLKQYVFSYMQIQDEYNRI